MLRYWWCGANGLLATATVNSFLKDLNLIYQEYCGVTLTNPEKYAATSATITLRMQKLIKAIQNGGNIAKDPPLKKQYDAITDFFKSLTDTGNVFALLTGLATALTGKSNPSGGSALEVCASAIFKAWYADPNYPKFPTDDRQYYDLITAWVFNIIEYQIQVLQMLQSANMYM